MLLCVQQHGFPKGRGTDTATIELLRNLTSSVLYLDYSRAFNTVDYAILIHKIKYYVFSEMACSDLKIILKIGSSTQG